MFIKWQIDTIHDRLKRNHDFITKKCSKQNTNHFQYADPTPTFSPEEMTHVSHFIAQKKGVVYKMMFFWGTRD